MNRNRLRHRLISLQCQAVLDQVKDTNRTLMLTQVWNLLIKIREPEVISFLFAVAFENAKAFNTGLGRHERRYVSEQEKFSNNSDPLLQIPMPLHPPSLPKPQTLHRLLKIYSEYIQNLFRINSESIQNLFRISPETAQNEKEAYDSELDLMQAIHHPSISLRSFIDRI